MINYRNGRQDLLFAGCSYECNNKHVKKNQNITYMKNLLEVKSTNPLYIGERSTEHISKQKKSLNFCDPYQYVSSITTKGGWNLKSSKDRISCWYHFNMVGHDSLGGKQRGLHQFDFGFIICHRQTRTQVPVN